MLAASNPRRVAMFPKQLGGSLVVSKGETLVAIQPSKRLVRDWFRKGCKTSYPDRGLKGANALTRLLEVPILGNESRFMGTINISGYSYLNEHCHNLPKIATLCQNHSANSRRSTNHGCPLEITIDHNLRIKFAAMPQLLPKEQIAKGHCPSRLQVAEPPRYACAAAPNPLALATPILAKGQGCKHPVP